MLSLMKLVPKSADCQGEGPETLGVSYSFM